MNVMLKECGELLKWLEEERRIVQKGPKEEIQIYTAMIREYQKVMLKMEQIFMKQDVRKYLAIRRARHAVKQGFANVVPVDILYSWLVENVCDLEEKL